MYSTCTCMSRESSSHVHVHVSGSLYPIVCIFWGGGGIFVVFVVEKRTMKFVHSIYMYSTYSTLYLYLSWLLIHTWLLRVS